MKRFLTTLLCIVIITSAGICVLDFTGVYPLEDLTAWIKTHDFTSLRSAWDDASQLATDTSVQIQSRLADFEPPTGEGSPLNGELPEDNVPDAANKYSFPESVYPYRAMLTGTERAAYDQAYANAVELYEQFPLHTTISTDSVSRVMSALFCDHPELFWLDTAYQYSYTGKDQVVAVTLTFNYTADDIGLHRSRFDAAAEKALTGARKLDSDAERELYIHDYLLDNVSYSLDAQLNQSAYSALVYGESVCAGYSRAFQYLVQQLDIPCYYCTGYAGEEHAWNIVNLDGEYYHVDVAWDDPLGNESGRRYYNYFNITDAQISADHTRSDLSVDLPACRGTKYSYTNLSGTQDVTSVPAATERSLSDTGFSPSEAIATLNEYYSYCENRLSELGTGTHTFSVLLANRDLLEAVFTRTEDGAALEAYLPGAARQLGLSGYSANVSLQAEELTDGYWLLTQQIRFEGQQETRDRPELSETPSDHAFPSDSPPNGNAPMEVRPDGALMEPRAA